MNRDAAVARIKRGLGFFSNTTQDANVVLALAEAQRDLEAGKTLPLFLLQEAQTLPLTAGQHTVNLPSDFIREADDHGIYYTDPTGPKPVFLQRKQYKDALLAYGDETDPQGPKIYVLLKSTIDFIVTADQNYSLKWSYYKKAAALTTGATENEWLTEATGAPEWLIGAAGLIMATDLRDADGIGLFTAMRDKARAACFGETIAREESGDNWEMGEDN